MPPLFKRPRENCRFRHGKSFVNLYKSRLCASFFHKYEDSVNERPAVFPVLQNSGSFADVHLHAPGPSFAGLAIRAFQFQFDGDEMQEILR